MLWVELEARARSGQGMFELGTGRFDIAQGGVVQVRVRSDGYDGDYGFVIFPCPPPAHAL